MIILQLSLALALAVVAGAPMSNITGRIYPSETLYPANNLYPAA